MIGIYADGRPYARALVSEAGWLLSAMRFAPGDPDVDTKPVEWAREIASAEGHVSPQIRFVHMYNNLTHVSGSADYDPFFEVSSPGRPTLYVAQDGSAFEADQLGVGIGFWRDGQHRFTRIR